MLNENDLEEKISKLPSWARSYISDLRKRADPNHETAKAFIERVCKEWELS